MSAVFAIAMPVGPGSNPWLRHALRSIAVQSPKTRVAVCAVERSRHVEAALDDFSGLIDYVRIGADSGQSAAINEGWAALEADYYGWLNDDDMLHPEALSRALSAFSTGVDVVHGRSDTLRNGVLSSGYGDAPVTEGLFRDNTVAQPSTFVTRSALDRVAMIGADGTGQYLDPDLHYTMDWDLWCRLLEAGAAFQALPQTLSITRWYDETKTSELTSKRLAETYRQVRRNSGRAKALWSLLNIMVHTRAQSEAPSKSARMAKVALQTVHDRRSDGTDAVSSHPLEVFHYEDVACAVPLPGEAGVMSLPPGEALQLDSGSLAVPFS